MRLERRESADTSTIDTCLIPFKPTREKRTRKARTRTGTRTRLLGRFIPARLCKRLERQELFSRVPGRQWLVLPFVRPSLTLRAGARSAARFNSLSLSLFTDRSPAFRPQKNVSIHATSVILNRPRVSAAPGLAAIAHFYRAPRKAPANRDCVHFARSTGRLSIASQRCAIKYCRAR